VVHGTRGARYSTLTPQNPQRNIGRQSIFGIDPFKGITCHLQGIEPGWGG